MPASTISTSPVAAAAGTMKGERRSKRRGQSVELRRFPNYGVGDDLRFIDGTQLRPPRSPSSASASLKKETSRSTSGGRRANRVIFGHPTKPSTSSQSPPPSPDVGLCQLQNRRPLTAFRPGVVPESGALARPTRQPELSASRRSTRSPQALHRRLQTLRAQLAHRRLPGVSDFFVRTASTGLRSIAGGNTTSRLPILSPQKSTPICKAPEAKDMRRTNMAEVSITQP